MLNEKLVASDLSDYSTDRLASLRCLIGYFESYLEYAYDNFEYSFDEYLSDLDQDLLLGEFDEIIRRRLCLSFSVTVELQKESEIITIATRQCGDDVHLD
jgi:hypothetical protein